MHLQRYDAVKGGCKRECYGGVQVAKADLQRIAESLNQASDTYKQLLAKRNELAKSVEKLKLMEAWQVCTCAGTSCGVADKHGTYINCLSESRLAHSLLPLVSRYSSF